MALTNNWTPKLGLDLRGGTTITLTAQNTSGTGQVDPNSLKLAQSIIQARVDSLGGRRERGHHLGRQPAHRQRAERPAGRAGGAGRPDRRAAVPRRLRRGAGDPARAAEYRPERGSEYGSEHDRTPAPARSRVPVRPGTADRRRSCRPRLRPPPPRGRPPRARARRPTRPSSGSRPSTTRPTSPPTPATPTGPSSPTSPTSPSSPATRRRPRSTCSDRP